MSGRLLVCGSRDWTDRAALYRCLDAIAGVIRVEVVIEGEAAGADRLAREWGEARGLTVLAFPASWKKLGRRAGTERNERMLRDGRPDYVVAFPLVASRGTWNMVSLALGAGVKVWIMPRDMAEIDALGEGVFA